MNERSGQNHTGTKLLDNSRRHSIDRGKGKFDQQHRKEDTKGTGNKDHE